MKRTDLKSMSTPQLSMLYDEIAATLTEKIIAKKRVLEDRLKQLNRRASLERTSETARRRAYPIVLPKFRNPDNMSETWTGRGKKPRWLRAQLRSGKQIEDFRIDF
jgi:DNA-binding protein H-NS